METTSLSPSFEVHVKAKKNLLYWAMASMTIFFGAFMSYYMVMHGNNKWLEFRLPDTFLISTAILTASSLTMIWAQQSAKQNKIHLIQWGVLATLIMGIIFCYLQFIAYQELIESNIYFAGKNSNISGSILYVITFMHVVHLFFGLLALIVTYRNASKGKYSAENYLGLDLCGIFWHFLDILWLILFLFLYFNR